jgi:hypothetical protein
LSYPRVISGPSHAVPRSNAASRSVDGAWTGFPARHPACPRRAEILASAPSSPSEELGVHPEARRHAVTGALRPGVEPGGHGSVAKVIRALGQRRSVLAGSSSRRAWHKRPFRAARYTVRCHRGRATGADGTGTWRAARRGPVLQPPLVVRLACPSTRRRRGEGSRDG